VYVVTDGVWQSAFAVTGAGVVVFDPPETYAGKIRAAIGAVTSQPITTLVFTHIHKDHIGGSAAFADIKGLEIVALRGVARFLAEKKDPIVYIPRARFLMAIDTLAPGYCPFMGSDITSNFHEYLRVLDVLLEYDFDVFVGGHLTHVGNRSDVKLTREFTRDVYETVKRVHRETDLMGVFAETAGQIGANTGATKALLLAVLAARSHVLRCAWFVLVVVATFPGAGYESVGRTFESCRAHHSFNGLPSSASDKNCVGRIPP
jgi:glyoxylase-like metal-dependent hydrolase (beta-lactamase superfamily II)